MKANNIPSLLSMHIIDTTTFDKRRNVMRCMYIAFESGSGMAGEIGSCNQTKLSSIPCQKEQPGRGVDNDMQWRYAR
jgi:hypothetical protein